jgi:proteic killer suppression protein
VIVHFRCIETEDLFFGWQPRRFPSEIIRTALRKLSAIDSVERLIDLAIPPGNRLEALKGDREGQYSIRINDQWRICFEWHDGNAREVEIVDYH